MDRTASSHRLLIVDDDEGVRNFITRGLARAGFTTVAADGGVTGIAQLSSNKFDAVVCDLNMPDKDGLDVLRYSASLNPRPVFIVLTGFGSISVAVEAMKRGASDFIEKPVAIDSLRAAIVSALNRATRERIPPKELVGSPQWLEPFMTSLRRIAQRDATVLIEGETGTGKSAVAREIWRQSARSKGPFVEMNCAAIPDNLMESELFGHRKGAFSGAIADATGRVEEASSGTLFLDEIGELKLELQAKLLHLLQEKTFTPVGSPKPQQADVRFIAATNRNLENEVDGGRFRSDLYYRLNVVGLVIPPLRDRPTDVPLLIEHFRARLLERQPGETPPTFSPEALEVMMHYSWRGNVRELENMVERVAVIHAPGTVIVPSHLPPRMREEANASTSTPAPAPSITRHDTPAVSFTPVLLQPAPSSGEEKIIEEGGQNLEEVSLNQAVAIYEKRRIIEAIEACHWNKSQAARKLGLKRTTLIEKMKKLGIFDPSSES